jgi:hypothetical protein
VSTTDDAGQALQDALARLLGEVGRLAVARGLPYAAAEEMLKLAFVEAASAAHPDLLPHRKVSRIATATGINRREVTRLTQPARLAQSAADGARRARGGGRSIASELFRLWHTEPAYLDASGQPRPLPRKGDKPSFESLAHEITWDVHPRSLLDELCRLGIARLDAATDRVELLQDAFVPRGDQVRMLGFLGHNVGDHLEAAVDNVLGDAPRHFEQALFADGLSAASIEALRPAVREQWAVLRAALVPVLETLIARDDALPAEASGRIRIGLYAFGDADAAATDAPPPMPPSASPTPEPGEPT